MQDEYETFNIGDKVYHYDIEDDKLYSGTIVFIISRTQSVIKRDDNGKNEFFHNELLFHNPIDDLKIVRNIYESNIKEYEESLKRYQERIELIDKMIAEQEAKINGK